VEAFRFPRVLHQQVKVKRISGVNFSASAIFVSRTNSFHFLQADRYLPQVFLAKELFSKSLKLEFKLILLPLNVTDLLRKFSNA
jgi:hypothetical protein